MYQVFGNMLDAFATYSCSASFGLNITPKRDDEKSLFGAVQEMDEEVPIIVPVVQVYQYQYMTQCQHFEFKMFDSKRRM